MVPLGKYTDAFSPNRSTIDASHPHFLRLILLDN
jgi:hypothetical protein